MDADSCVCAFFCCDRINPGQRTESRSRGDSQYSLRLTILKAVCPIRWVCALLSPLAKLKTTVFLYTSSFHSPVSTAASVEGAEEDAAASEPATIASQRTLTLFNTPIEEARVRVVNNPTYYAELLGTSVESLGTSGFSEVNDTLTCEDNGVAATPTPPAPQSTFADLPDGNYRLASADFPPERG